MEARTPRVAILISGRGSNMEAILRNVRAGTLACEVALVVSSRPEAGGLERARALGFPTAALDARGLSREEFDRRLRALLEPLRLDWLVLAGYLRLLTPEIVRRYRDRIVNIHPADTRLHQGLHGYRWAFERGLASTWVTVHLVDEGIDTGRILAQAEVDLAGARTVEEVERRGLAVEHRLYSEVLGQLFQEESTEGGAP